MFTTPLTVVINRGHPNVRYIVVNLTVDLLRQAVATMWPAELDFCRVEVYDGPAQVDGHEGELVSEGIRVGGAWHWHDSDRSDVIITSALD